MCHPDFLSALFSHTSTCCSHFCWCFHTGGGSGLWQQSHPQYRITTLIQLDGWLSSLRSLSFELSCSRLDGVSFLSCALTQLRSIRHHPTSKWNAQAEELDKGQDDLTVRSGTVGVQKMFIDMSEVLSVKVSRISEPSLQRNPENIGSGIIRMVTCGHERFADGILQHRPSHH